MNSSLTIGRFAGIYVRIHWSFLLILLLAWSHLEGGEKTIINYLFELSFIMAVFFCVLLHEFGHAFAARGYGIPTRQIVLLPIGGVAMISQIPEKPKHELWITIAGPLVNIAIAILLIPVVYFLYPDIFSDNVLVSIDTALNWFFFRLMITNIALAVFNLVPVFPMDGGRILRAFLAFKLSYKKATLIAARIGQVLATVMVILGVYYTTTIALIGVFIFISAEAEYRMVKRREENENLFQ